jgi:hypothetical protein
MKSAMIEQKDGQYVVLVLENGIWVERYRSSSLEDAITWANRNGCNVIQSPDPEGPAMIL